MEPARPADPNPPVASQRGGSSAGTVEATDISDGVPRTAEWARGRYNKAVASCASVPMDPGYQALKASLPPRGIGDGGVGPKTNEYEQKACVNNAKLQLVLDLAVVKLLAERG
jgi:hypothetical protein